MGRKQLGKILRIVVETTDGMPVVAGLMKFCLTLGLPLEDGLSFLFEKKRLCRLGRIYI